MQDQDQDQDRTSQLQDKDQSGASCYKFTSSKTQQEMNQFNAFNYIMEYWHNVAYIYIFIHQSVAIIISENDNREK